CPPVSPSIRFPVGPSICPLSIHLSALLSI
ncbi:hypothetical protein BIW11_05004, partial [Tropilaelaps mercedesae]